MICPPQENCKAWTHVQWHKINNITWHKCADCKKHGKIVEEATQ